MFWNFEAPDILLWFSGVVGVLWILCAIYVAERTSYGLLCSIVLKFLCAWLAGQRTEKCAYGWLPRIFGWLAFFIFGWVAHWPKSWRYGHVPVFESRIVQTKIYIVCFLVVLFVFGACSTRIAKCVVGLTYTKCCRGGFSRRDWACAKLFFEQ